MEFIFGLSNYVLENISAKDIPNLATQALVEGYDSPSLRILAGLKDDNSWEIDQYLKFTLNELNIKIPNNEEAGLIVINYYLNKIVRKEIEPILGLEKVIYEVLRKVNSFRSGSKKYVYDKIEFHKLYGLYYEYDDIASDNYKNKRKNKIIDEIFLESDRFLQNLGSIKDRILNDN